ncbi:phosphoglycerate dehydrogenase [Natronococcus amylolyticus DSM 10524]|uniref:Phosphoglycerate dehydrogenase n=1 Tax=Natronococcus amylolyticus DSM 10524 TaxID=1227497 RepID=L9X642_9EURY|nr:NAD(P)-dependent oxidoreductase [Natronococcus amylolyticus]ELY56033.1 phosphoglycerate dehydrogenase [Natronococcus amylolyticus DSM 10524]
MIQGLVDQDIKPSERLCAGVDDSIDLEFGVDNTEEALISSLENKEVLFTTSRLPVTRQVLTEVTGLRLVAKIGTGLDSIDLGAAAANDVTVVYTPGLNARSVAEHALSLLLAVNRNVILGQRTLEAGGWRDSMPTSQPVAGKTVGIIGFGNVGSRVAGLLSGFDVDILTYDPYIHEIDTQITGAERASLEKLLTSSDAVIVTAELTEETCRMIDREALELMSERATLVNTARGPVVDQEALIEAIRDGTIAGAGLDVFETEPLPSDSSLHEYDNIVVTPHIGASTIDAREAAIDTLSDLANMYINDDRLPERFVAVRPS